MGELNTWFVSPGHHTVASVKAARIHEYGSDISYDDVPIPVPSPGEVLIKVAATSFNPTEAALCAGLLADLLPIGELPFTLGWDVAGTVIARGSGADRFELGDQVIGVLDGGAAAEYATAPAVRLVPAPATVPLEHAAAIPLAGLTAWQAVFEHGQVVAGQRVLVNGAGGGVGGFAVQLAKHAGAFVIATASPRSTATVRELGADQVVDYTVTPVTRALAAKVDVALNVVGFGPQDDIVPWVEAGGRIISVSVPVDVPSGVDVTASHMVMRNDVQDLAALVKLVDAGVVSVAVTDSVPLAGLAEVHRRSAAGLIHGKVVIRP
jgi:NADPH:quinone reductase-like Zn-dependent oxidoreductase